MDTRDITSQRLAESIIAVPPMARDSNGKVCARENKKLIDHIQQGGVNTLLYGGNAIFYHLRLSEYESTLSMLAETVADDTLIVPSVGPSFGLMMDQAEILKQMDFPTAMILPSTEINTQQGLIRGIRRFAEAYGKPIVLYLKHNRWLPAADVRSLVRDGLVSWIKYAVVLPDPAADDYLKEIVDVAPTDLMVSGMGEQPAICHMQKFKMVGFTSGCVCVAPTWSTRMLQALQAGDVPTAEMIRSKFKLLEDLRDGVNPIRVLHYAVEYAKICQTGEITPMLGELNAAQIEQVRRAAEETLAWENSARHAAASAS